MNPEYIKELQHSLTQDRRRTVYNIAFALAVRSDAVRTWYYNDPGAGDYTIEPKAEKILNTIAASAAQDVNEVIRLINKAAETWHQAAE